MLAKMHCVMWGARGNLGAFQKNTLETNLNNLRYSTENLVAAESGIRDTEMAAEMSEFTKQQILMAMNWRLTFRPDP